MADSPNKTQAGMGTQGNSHGSDDKEMDSADGEENHVDLTASAGRTGGQWSSETSSAGVADDMSSSLEGGLGVHRSGHERRNEEAGEPVSLTANHDGLSGSSGDGLTDGQKKERSTNASLDPLQDSTESSTVLHKILDTMKDATKALRTLQESSEQGVQNFKDFADTMASEAKETNNLLRTLVQEIGKLSCADSSSTMENTGDFNVSVPGSYNICVANLSNKERDPPELQQDRDDAPMVVKVKSETTMIDRIEDIRLQKNHAQDAVDPEHGKYLEDPLCPLINNPHARPRKVSEKSCKQEKEGSDTSKKRENEPSRHQERARDSTAENSTGRSFRQSTPPQVSQNARTTKAKTKLSPSEEDETQSLPTNVSENRTPSSDSRTQDVRPKETNRPNRHRNRISAQSLAIECGSDSESQRLDEALARARAPDLNPPPKAKSYDTVLCLDTSDSMLQGNAHEQMIEVANKFIDGVEDMTSEVEENIGVVTFGGRANIVQHLTNDFSLVRKAVNNTDFGGSSPFFEAMVICLTAFDGKGGTVSVSGEYEVHPRIIFITDGHITEGTDDPFDRVIDATNTRARFSRLMMDLNPRKDPSMPHPILFVPVGSRTDGIFMKSMAELSGGQLVEAENLASICNYYKIQETIGKVIVCMRNMNTQDTSEEQIQAIVMALTPTINDQEMAVVTAGVSREMMDPNRRRGRSDPTAFDDVFENTDAVALSERLPLGTRVVRGPDWRWDNQDRRRPGTVIQHEVKKHGFTWVLWDDGHKNRYPYGSEMGYHIWKTNDHPVLRSPDGKLRIGMTVKKGPNWPDPQTKNDGEIGSIIRMSKDGRQVKVRWRNGVLEARPVGAVEFSDPFDHDGDRGGNEEENNPSQPEPEEEEEEEEDDEDKIRVWQWRDDWGNWRLYSKQEIQRLEAAYKRKKNGTCVFQRGSKQVRILFQRKTEKDVDKHTERDIQRILLPEHEVKSLEVAEELVSRG